MYLYKFILLLQNNGMPVLKMSFFQLPKFIRVIVFFHISCWDIWAFPFAVICLLLYLYYIAFRELIYLYEDIVGF